MSVVKINAITVPEGMGPELERRFAARAGLVQDQPGFEAFQLLRPVEGEERYFVMTWWDSEDSFQAWLTSQDFAKGHAQAAADAQGAQPGGGEGQPGGGEGHGGGHPHAGGGHGHGGPVATGSEVLGFEVVERIDGPSK